MYKMRIREAKIEDIKQIQVVRNSVVENKLSDPSVVTDEICTNFITERGKGWVCEVENQIVGFCIVDFIENNIWALFLMPEFENKGYGILLHNTMLDWYFKQTKTSVWLGTTPKTRAEGFYRKLGWIEIGNHSKGEIKFEMTFENWWNTKSI